MKWSQILHGISAISGIAGFLALIMWWIVLAARDGFSTMFSPDHLYDDARVLLLLSIAFGIGTLIHQLQERRGQQ